MKKILSFTLIMIITLLITGTLGSSTQRVQAQMPDPWVIQVNTFEDMRDFALNSVCSAGEAVDGPCSLRAALHEASYHAVGNAIIELPPGVYKLTLDKPSFDGEEEAHYGDLDIPGINNPRTGTLIIKGTGELDNPSIIDANFIDRVFEIGKNQIVALENLVLRNGLATEAVSGQEEGGGIYVGDADLSLSHVRLTHNEARSEGDTISEGGAIYSFGAKLNIAHSEIAHNKADIVTALSHRGHTHQALIYSTSIHHNVISKDYSAHISGKVMVTNSTMAYNQGGDAYIDIATSFGWVQNSTLVASGPMNLVNLDNRSHLYYNIMVNLPDANGDIGLNCHTRSTGLISKGGNIFTDDSCHPDAALDQMMSPTKVKLAPFGNYGGLTPTIALMDGSPAIDHGDANCMTWWEYTMPKGSPITNDYSLVPLMSDQRFFPRTDGKCDIGAFELQPTESYDALMLYLPITIK